MENVESVSLAPSISLELFAGKYDRMRCEGIF